MSAFTTRQRRFAFLLGIGLAVLLALKIPFLPVAAQPALLWLGAIYLRVFAPDLLRLLPLLLLGIWQDLIWQWPVGISLVPLFVLYISATHLQQFSGNFLLQWLAIGIVIGFAAGAEWAAMSLVQDAFMPTAPMLGRFLATWLLWPFIYLGFHRLLARWRLRNALRRREA